jgi:membrane fusion protein (multidrug efflux system)
VPETYLSLLKVGNLVNGSSPAWPGELFAGEVVSVGSRVDPVTRSITVRAIIDNADLRLRPGMLMGVELIAAQRQGLVLPEAALIQVGGKSMVYVVGADNKAERRVLTIGKRQRGGVEVIRGLAVGEQVVVNGQFNLRPGAAVRVMGR